MLEQSQLEAKVREHERTAAKLTVELEKVTEA